MINEDSGGDEIRDKLDDEQYRVTQEKGTERAFTGKYVDHKADGTCDCWVSRELSRRLSRDFRFGHGGAFLGLLPTGSEQNQ